MEWVVSRENRMAAHRRVVANKGAAGVDAMPVEDVLAYLREHWASIKEDLLNGRYEPSAVVRVEIPKPGGGMRQLGIPTVQDRLIQQALHPVLTPIFDPDFSGSSYEFRPGRSAHQAVLAARVHVASGRRWVVDMDLEKFFDRVNHDVLIDQPGAPGGLARAGESAPVDDRVDRARFAGVRAPGEGDLGTPVRDELLGGIGAGQKGRVREIRHRGVSQRFRCIICDY